MERSAFGLFTAALECSTDNTRQQQLQHGSCFSKRSISNRMVQLFWRTAVKMDSYSAGFTDVRSVGVQPWVGTGHFTERPQPPRR